VFCLQFGCKDTNYFLQSIFIFGTLTQFAKKDDRSVSPVTVPAHPQIMPRWGMAAHGDLSNFFLKDMVGRDV
jgi:hypothetical protein